MELLELVLPWPPSVNHYWGQSGRRRYLTMKAKHFREMTRLAVAKRGWPKFEHDARLSVEVLLYPPDRRRRDIDNVCKGLLDALQHCHVYDDDNQIDELYIRRLDMIESKVIVNIRCL